MSEWGNPLRVTSEHFCAESIGAKKRTGESETSHDPQEKKTSDSLSSGERKGRSLNRRYVKAGTRCTFGVAGKGRVGVPSGRKVTNRIYSRTVWND